MWIVVVNENNIWVGLEYMKLLEAGITKNDLTAQGWNTVGNVSFEHEREAIRYCKQMGFRIPEKKKRVRL